MKLDTVEQTTAYARGKPDWLVRYVSAHAISAVHDVFDELRGSEPAPFSGWQLWTAHASDIPPAVSQQLRQHLTAGGIVIMLATPAAAKAHWLTSLTAGDDRTSQQDPAGSQRTTAPLAIEGAGQYERGGVLTSIALATSRHRGIILTFRDPDEFRDFEIASYIANQNVVIFAFVETEAAQAACRDNPEAAPGCRAARAARVDKNEEHRRNQHRAGYRPGFREFSTRERGGTAAAGGSA